MAGFTLRGFRIEHMDPRPGESWPEVRERYRRVMNGRVPGPPAMKVRRHGGYHPGLARFPGDPEAFADDSWSLRKAIDRRKREGWVETSAQEIAEASTRRATDDGGDLILEALEKVQSGQHGFSDQELQRILNDGETNGPQ